MEGEQVDYIYCPEAGSDELGALGFVTGGSRERERYEEVWIENRRVLLIYPNGWQETATERQSCQALPHEVE